ncbi:MAG: PTS sugar transporter subunit IIA [Planctomycetota bacterium]
MMMRKREPLLIAAMIALLPATAWASTGGEGMTGRMMTLVLQVGVILFVAKLGSRLFEKLGLPGALGELTAGIVIGPYALGGLGFYGFPDGLFAAVGGTALSPELQGLAAIAAIVLLFEAGLETDLKLLMRYAVIGGIVGLGGMVASFFVGAAAVKLFATAVVGEPVSLFAPPCLFLGAVTTATSVGITARVLSQKRKLDSAEGVTIISAAVIDDVLGIILLAMVMSLVTASKAGGVDWAHLGIVGGKAVGVWLGATILGLAASRRISLLLKWFGERNSIAVMALGLALILAGLFEEAGLAMIIGAYVMGLSLSTSDLRHVIAEKLSPIDTLLVPLFFCTAGMRIDLRVLGNPAVLGFGVAYAFGALASKVVGCGLPALLVRFNLRGAARIGFGMAPRCEVALIIAGVGLAADIISPAIFAGVILMVVVNTVVAPPALVGLLRSKARGTRGSVEVAPPEREMTFEFPTMEMAEFFVAKLVPVFEAEGFFVHQISREHGLFQLRKDDSVIDLAHQGATLRFSCRQSDSPLIQAAMYEGLAALERSVQALRKPLDAKTIRTGLQQLAAGGPPELRMADFLTERLIVPELTGTTKEAIIDELLDVLDDAGLLSDRAVAREAVWDRERSMSTGLQYGVAIPHGKTDAVNRLVCCVGLKHEGVDFDAMDDEPSRIFILTLSPKSRPAPHLQFMSAVSRILNAEGRRRILAAATGGQIVDVFAAPPVAAPPRPVPAKLVLADYVRPETVRPHLHADTKEGVVRELIDLLAAQGLITDPDTAYRAVMQREQQLSTAMEHGIAIPHGRTGAVDRLVCAVGVKRDGIDFGAADGGPTRLFVLVLTTEGGAEPYLQFVASVMGALSGPGRTRALEADMPEELYKALTAPTA